MTKEKPTLIGWAFPSLYSKKAHVFQEEDRRALCGKWMIPTWFPTDSITEADPKAPKGADDCATCSRKLAALA